MMSRPRSSVRSILKYWLPPLIWAVAISVFSTSSFSSDQTSQFFVPILQWAFPQAPMDVLLALHFSVRKFGLLSEYFLLTILLYRAFREDTTFRWQPRWAVATLSLVLLYSVADELHQSFVPNRSATAGDSLIDFLGGSCAIALLYLRHRAQSVPAS